MQQLLPSCYRGCICWLLIELEVNPGCSTLGTILVGSETMMQRMSGVFDGVTVPAVTIGWVRYENDQGLLITTT
jgi:hypothetical protein